MIGFHKTRPVVLLLLLLLALPAAALPGVRTGLPGPGESGRLNETPEELQDVGVTEHRGEQMPLDLQFVDHTGAAVTLGEYFDQGKPVILNLGYYRCPQLCGLILNGLADAMDELDWSAGEQFTVVTVSVNPDETPEEAKAKRDMMISILGREKVAGWHFLVGQKPQIQALADAAGWDYRYLPEADEYAHPAALAVLTPGGVLSHYMVGIQYDPAKLRQAMFQAADGQIGSPIDRLVLSCFHLDPATGGYGLVAMNLMRLGGALTLGLLVFAIGVALLVEMIRRSRAKRMAVA
jgi:protein SCO1/2